MMQTPWTSQHIEYVEHATLPRQRGGYVTGDVDRQLQRILALMKAGRQVPQIAPTALRRTRIREGYTPEKVEALMDQLMAWQRELDQVRRAEEPAAAPTPSRPSAPVPRPTERLRWTRQQQEWVRESTFTLKGGSRSYEADEVDDFLDRVLVAMAKGEPLPDIESVKFYPPRFAKSGYDAIMVDEFLDQLASLRPAPPEA